MRGIIFFSAPEAASVAGCDQQRVGCEEGGLDEASGLLLPLC